MRSGFAISGWRWWQCCMCQTQDDLGDRSCLVVGMPRAGHGLVFRVRRCGRRAVGLDLCDSVSRTVPNRDTVLDEVLFAKLYPFYCRCFFRIFD